MLQSATSSVRRRSASLLVHNEQNTFTSSGIHGETTLSYLDFQPSIDVLNSVEEQGVTEKHCGECGQHPCQSFCETLPGDGHVSYHPNPGCPPAFDDLHHSSATRHQTPDGFPTVVRTDFVDYPKLLPSGQLKLTNKWPPPSTLKYLAVSTSYKPVEFPAVLSLERGQGSTLSDSGRWNPSKIWLLLSCMTVFTYGTIFLLWASVTWFDGEHYLVLQVDLQRLFSAWAHADAMAVTDHDILVLITVTATLLVFSSMIGISGTMLNSRPLLAIYTLLLWPDQASILAVGYVAYKRVTFNFDRKMNFAWSRLYTVLGRQIIQDSFGCCGFFNTMHEAAPSKRCYIRATIPGCRDALFDFERTNLAIIWKVAFALAALHIMNMITALLCSNHVTNRFGKGLTPGRYRLCSDDIKAETRGTGLVINKPDGHNGSQDGMARRSKGEVHYVD